MTVQLVLLKYQLRIEATIYKSRIKYAVTLGWLRYTLLWSSGRQFGNLAYTDYTPHG